MRTQIIVLVALTAIVIVAVWTVALRTEVTLNDNGTEIVSVDVFGIGKKPAQAPVELSAQRRER